MDIFEKLKSGEAVDMHSEEYRPVVAELHRSYKALHHLNSAEPLSAEQTEAMNELFDGSVPEGLGLFTPVQIDFPKQMTCRQRPGKKRCRNQRNMQTVGSAGRTGCR